MLHLCSVSALILLLHCCWLLLLQEAAVSEAEQNTAAVLEEYAHLERSGGISPQHRASLRPQQQSSVGSMSSFFDSASAARPVQLFPAF